MTIYYVTDGPWGVGGGVLLDAWQIDGNFYDLDSRITAIEDSPVAPIAPLSMALDGTAFTIGWSNGTTTGPIVVPLLLPTNRGDWAPLTAYQELDYFTAPTGELGAVLVAHTSAATFDWAATEGGDLVYRSITGSANGALSGLSDVTITDLLGGQGLRYDGDLESWVNAVVGDAAGPTDAIDGNFAAFDGATGKLLKDSGISLDAVALKPDVFTWSGGADYPLTYTDAGIILEMNRGSANTVTIQPDATINFPIGTLISVTQFGAGATSIVADTGVTLNGVLTGSCTLTAQWSGVSLYKRDDDNWVVQGAHGGVA